MASQELDVRGLRKPDKHPAIFQAYSALEVEGSVDLVNDHDPKHLREGGVRNRPPWQPQLGVPQQGP